MHRALSFVIQSLVWPIMMKPLFLLFCNFEVKGYERIKDHTAPLIFAPNHSNTLDAFLIPLALPFLNPFSPIFYVVREKRLYAAHHTNWIKKMVFGGWTFYIMGGLPYRANQKDYAVSLEKHAEMLSKKGSICIFPDGTRTKDGVTLRAHGGAGYLAFASKRPIVPILIRGTFKTTLKDILKRKKITVEFFSPLEFSDLFDKENPEIEEFKKAAEKSLNVIRAAKNEPLVEV